MGKKDRCPHRMISTFSAAAAQLLPVDRECDLPNGHDGPHRNVALHTSWSAMSWTPAGMSKR